MNHTFPITHKNAYDAEEVDRFLDMVIQDYKLVEASVVIPTTEYESLKQKNKVLESDKSTATRLMSSSSSANC